MMDMWYGACVCVIGSTAAWLRIEVYYSWHSHWTYLYGKYPPASVPFYVDY